MQHLHPGGKWQREKGEVHFSVDLNLPHLQHLGLNEVIERIAHRYFDRDEDEPHRILAGLPLSTYVTTNYDSFMSAALRWEGKTPRRQHCIWRRDLEDEAYENLQGSCENPLVFHLYGNDEDPMSRILTDDDYLNFLSSLARDYDIRIPATLQVSLSGCMLLFLGYRALDLDYRVLLQSVVAPLRISPRGRLAVFSVESVEDESKQIFIQKTNEEFRIMIYWGSLREFLIELRDRWQAENA